MIILAIETSCDDTGVAVVEATISKKSGGIPQFNILVDVVSSQVKIHEKYGGVYPFLAKREHQKNLPHVFESAMRQAKNAKIDAIAVTAGPGLEPCLWQGINFANDLAQKQKKPLIAVNHIEAHILANFFPIQETEKIFPAVCLVVSGGHTQLILIKAIGKYEILGETRDDAAGECFDKTARILGLGYPGGPIISEKAKEFQSLGRKSEIKLPRPMIATKDYDFSFSGLKTAVLYLVKQLKKNKNLPSAKPCFSAEKLTKKIISEICFEIQQSAIDVLLKKTLKAAKDYRVKSVFLAGGVSANTELRKQLKAKVEKEILNAKFFVPDLKYCTDNAAMVGIAAFLRMQKQKKRWKTIAANANLRIDQTI